MNSSVTSDARCPLSALTRIQMEKPQTQFILFMIKKKKKGNNSISRGLKYGPDRKQIYNQQTECLKPSEPATHHRKKLEASVGGVFPGYNNKRKNNADQLGEIRLLGKI